MLKVFWIANVLKYEKKDKRLDSENVPKVTNFFDLPHHT